MIPTAAAAPEPARLERRAARLLPGRPATRIDGNPRGEYIDDDRNKHSVRQTAAVLLFEPVNRRAGVAKAWRAAARAD